MNNDEIFFEATSRNAQTFEGYTLRLYTCGLYQKITYEKSDSPENSRTQIQTIGENPIAKFYVEYVLNKNRALGLESYENEYEEIRIDNPYASSEICYVRFEKITFRGMNLFTLFPEEKLEKLNLNSSKEEQSAYRKVRIISRLKSEIVITLKKVFEKNDSEFEKLSIEEETELICRNFYNAAHPVENRKEKDQLFKKFMEEVLNEFVNTPMVKKSKRYTYKIERVNITEKYTNLGLSDKYATKIDKNDRVYYSKINGEKLFIFTDSFFDLLGYTFTHSNLEFFEKFIGENLEAALIKVCSRRTFNRMKISAQKVSTFVGKSSPYLKEETTELGCYVRFSLSNFGNVLCIWISENFIKQLNIF